MNKGKTKKKEENNRVFIPKEFIRSKRNEKKNLWSEERKNTVNVT